MKHLHQNTVIIQTKYFKGSNNLLRDLARRKRRATPSHGEQPN